MAKQKAKSNVSESSDLVDFSCSDDLDASFANAPFANAPFANTPFANAPFANTPFANTPGTDIDGLVDSKNTRLPAAAIGRMSLYLRELRRLEASAILSVNSRDLAKRLNVSAALVRRDLAMMGSVGKRGIGYEVTALASHLRTVLGSKSNWRVALIGTGSLGLALLRYPGFERLGFQLVAALDTDPSRIGKKIAGITIRDAAKIKTIFRQVRPQLAILAVPADVAPEVAVKLARAGISGILNFAPTSLKLPPEIGVVNVDLASEMQRLAFHVSQQARQSDPVPRSDSD